MKILALIPARSGSKGIPHKNIQPFRGKPLMAHSIEQAKASRLVGRVLVSTDSEDYAIIARQFGADTPFLRPAEYAGDLATDVDVFGHALGWLEKHEGYRPDICVHLRPTYPTRRVEDIDEVIRLLQSDPTCDSVRSITDAPETPFKTWFMDEAGWLRPVVTDPLLPEAYNRPRQELPRAFQQNAAVDAVWSRVIREQRSMSGRRIRGYLMREFCDIDTPAHLIAAQWGEAGVPAGKTFVFDIDGVIATLTPGNDYNQAQPAADVVRAINRLHRAGNRIVLHTARGSATGLDWSEVTRRQMAQWGVDYDEIRFGKPAGDYYIDDRMLGLTDLLKLVAEREE